eukprot:2373715-Lingulodinium_polyedra.AAC.1
MLRVTTRGGPVSGGMRELRRRYSLKSRRRRPPSGQPRVHTGAPLPDRSSGDLPRRTGSALAAGPA